TSPTSRRSAAMCRFIWSVGGNVSRLHSRGLAPRASFFARDSSRSAPPPAFSPWVRACASSSRPSSPLLGPLPTGERGKVSQRSRPSLARQTDEAQEVWQTRWKGHQAVVNQRKMHAYFSDGERVVLAKERLKNQELAEENRMGSGRFV